MRAGVDGATLPPIGWRGLRLSTRSPAPPAFSDRAAAPRCAARELAYAATKRALDLVVAVTATHPDAPMFALIGLAIVRESGFPILYRAERVGRFGRPYSRSRSSVRCTRGAIRRHTRASCGASSKRQAPARFTRSPTIGAFTRVGRFLRRTSLAAAAALGTSSGVR